MAAVTPQEQKSDGKHSLHVWKSFRGRLQNYELTAAVLF